jgi:hypothetical protein
VRTWSFPASSCAAAIVLLTSFRAEAFERQWHAGVDAGYASLFGDASSGGFGGGAHLAYGLSDAFNALLDVDFTRHGNANTSIWSAGAGVAYTLDVARIVPYAGLMLGGYKLTGDLSTTAPGLQIPLGIDYHLDRSWAIGAQFRMHTIFAADPVGTLAYATTFARVEYLWGF